MAIPKLRLSSKPSALIRTALDGLAVIERDEKYQIEMGCWHQPDDGKCMVCLAGAVMANKVKDPYVTLEPANFGIKTGAKLIAINELREGELFAAARVLNLSEKKTMKMAQHFNIKSMSFLDDVVEITSYEEDRKQFKKDMCKLARDFEKIGM